MFFKLCRKDLNKSNKRGENTMLDLTSPSYMGWMTLIPIIICFIMFGLSIYTMVLLIKALKIYIKKNS